jgi:hypothetical protein
MEPTGSGGLNRRGLEAEEWSATATAGDMPSATTIGVAGRTCGGHMHMAGGDMRMRIAVTTITDTDITDTFRLTITLRDFMVGRTTRGAHQLPTVGDGAERRGMDITDTTLRQHRFTQLLLCG